MRSLYRGGFVVLRGKVGHVTSVAALCATITLHTSMVCVVDDAIVFSTMSGKMVPVTICTQVPFRQKVPVTF